VSAVAATRALAVPAPRRVPVRATAARTLFMRTVARLPGGGLRLVMPDGRVAVPGRPGGPTLTVHREDMFHRLGADGKIGFGEAYMAGDFTADDLAGALAAFAAGLDRLAPAPLRWARRVLEPGLPPTEDGAVENTPRNIARHYDLSNDLFALFLDGTMTYSCAIFEPGDSLERAQVRKYEALAALAGVGAGERVLEIGTGWGGMAMHLARSRGCRVTTATLSVEQAALARDRIAAAGLGDLVDVVVSDYRLLDGRYDRIVSIEMFEAVGERYWPEFFDRCDRLLAPGGTVGLQTITMPDRRYRATRRAYGWIHKYVFPGGLIPSREAIEDAVRARSSLRIEGPVHEIGPHYATTLRAWRERFLDRSEDVAALGFGREFRRMWEFYLAYCEAGFRTGVLGDVQLRLARP
jgi:cyclopropane-fatty-acyl-phospholipid synthase